MRLLGRAEWLSWRRRGGNYDTVDEEWWNAHTKEWNSESDTEATASVRAHAQEGSEMMKSDKQKLS